MYDALCARHRSRIRSIKDTLCSLESSTVLNTEPRVHKSTPEQRRQRFQDTKPETAMALIPHPGGRNPRRCPNLARSKAHAMMHDRFVDQRRPRI